MANTTYLKNQVEVYVRDWLTSQFAGRLFSKQTLMLATGGNHEFDAVSDDGSVVAAIKTSSYKTSGGKHPAGKFANLFAELYFLSLVESPRRLLVLTNAEMCRAFRKLAVGKLTKNTCVMFCPLPPNMIKMIRGVHEEASREQRNK